MGLLYLFTFGLFGIGWAVDDIRFLRAAIRGQRIGVKAVKHLSEDEPLPVVPCSLMLSDGEVCHYCEKASYVKIRNQVVGYSGGNAGISVRVAKGITYRTGRSAGTPIRGNITEKNDGYLQVTNKRIVFTGITASFDKKIKNLSSVTHFDNGIAFQFSSQQLLIQTDDHEYIHEIISRVVNDA